MIWIILSVIYFIGFIINYIVARVLSDCKLSWGDWVICIFWPLFWGAIATYIIIDKIKGDK